MKKETSLKLLLKISSVFLFYFVLLFLFITWDLTQNYQILKEGTTLGNLIIRYPYQWDYELFFAGLFLVWGIFLWGSSKNLEKNITFIKFTGLAFIVHAITMLIVGIVIPENFTHLLLDSIPWFILGTLILSYKRS